MIVYFSYRQFSKKKIVTSLRGMAIQFANNWNFFVGILILDHRVLIFFMHEFKEFGQSIWLHFECRYLWKNDACNTRLL